MPALVFAHVHILLTVCVCVWRVPRTVQVDRDGSGTVSSEELQAALTWSWFIDGMVRWQP